MQLFVVWAYELCYVVTRSKSGSGALLKKWEVLKLRSILPISFSLLLLGFADICVGKLPPYFSLLGFSQPSMD